MIELHQESPLKIPSDSNLSDYCSENENIIENKI